VGFTARGVVLTNQYIHPDGYLMTGLGRIVGDGRGVLRLESITRQVQGVDETTMAKREAQDRKAAEKRRAAKERAKAKAKAAKLRGVN
jgi:hypothetical protein